MRKVVFHNVCISHALGRAMYEITSVKMLEMSGPN
jgi:hypothetical protein